MNRNTESSRDRAPDDLDALLASRPVRPSADFASATLARIARERESADSPLDALLASRPVVAPAGFADRVLAAVAASRRRILFFRAGSAIAAAACVALVVAGSFRTVGTSGPTAAERIAATLESDAELSSLAALPAANAPSSTLADTRTRDLAAFADLDAALAASSTEYAYGI